MTDDVRPEVIKKTQDLLGKYFKKPPLTEKLLKKPPFRFLHDIVSAVTYYTFPILVKCAKNGTTPSISRQKLLLQVIKETGFLDGLFSEEELSSENIKDKEAKLAYLTKLVDVVKLISGTNLTVRPSKIISGQEPTKTNELLQAIGKALDKKVSSAEAIEHYKKSLEKKSKSSSKSKGKDEKKVPARPSSQARKPAEKEKLPADQRRRSASTSKVASDAEKRENAKNGKNYATEKAIKEDEEITGNKDVMEVPPAEPVREKIPLSAQRRRHSTSAKSKQDTASSTPSSDPTKQDSTQMNSVADPKIEQHARRKDSASRTKRSSHNRSSDVQSSTLSEVHPPFPEARSKGGVEIDKRVEDLHAREKDKETTGNGVSLQSKERPDPQLSEPREMESENIETNATQERPRTSLRPPTARPISARPAAPRMRAKTELIVNEEISTPMGNISVIIENADMKEEDDDAEDMVVMETKGGFGDPMENANSYKIDSQLTQEHGHLVAQILETQRELVNNENVDVLPKKTDIAWETGSKRNREVVAKEIEKLRSTIQTLTRATNPLGKLLDYVQEDVEMMQKELMDWRKQYTELSEQLEREQIQTRELIEPMKETLLEIDTNTKLQLDKICQVKYHIMKNDQKIYRLLNGHS